MSKKRDLLSTIKSVTDNVHLGNKSASDVADSVNAWLKEGGEALKVKIEDEVERSVSKMGFVKRGEFEALKQEVAALTGNNPKKKAKETKAKKSAKSAEAKAEKVKSKLEKAEKKIASKAKDTSSKKATK